MVPTTPAGDAVLNRVRAKRRTDLSIFDDLERNWQRARLERQGQILRLGE